MYVDYVKGYYDHDRFPPYSKENVVEVRAKDFVRVGMIHADKFLGKFDKEEAQRVCLMGRIKDLCKTRRSLTLDVFSSLLGSKFFTSILVEGVPGVGKTSFAVTFPFFSIKFWFKVRDALHKLIFLGCMVGYKTASERNIPFHSISLCSGFSTSFPLHMQYSFYHSRTIPLKW